MTQLPPIRYELGSGVAGGVIGMVAFSVFALLVLPRGAILLSMIGGGVSTLIGYAIALRLFWRRYE